MPVRPMLGDLELHRVQKIEVDGDQLLAQHAIPALEGDFLQRMERGAARVRLVGVLIGSEEVSEGLKQLRDAFYAAQPVTFVADIATATRIDQVVIEEMGVRELAGKPQFFEYSFTLVEFTELEPPQDEPVEPDEPDEPEPETARLNVEVIVEGVTDYDYHNVTVRVQGTDENDNTINEVLGEGLRTDNAWEKDPFPAGNYTVTASTNVPQDMTQSKSVQVPQAGIGQVTIVLRPSVSRIAQVFIVHFWFDKAFIEPCLRPVLKAIADYATAHADEKMLILGHTDLVGSEEYNDYLSDRRARSVHAYLTYGHDKPAALQEWQRLRQQRQVGNAQSINDTWDVREYQHMLQDLGHYRGGIDEDKGPLTRQAIRDFKTARGITPVDDAVTDETWDQLIEAYLDVTPVSVPAAHFFENCPNEVLKWQGCGEYDPVVNTGDAERRNRRTEVIFVKAEKLPRKMSPPVSFEMPASGAANSDWCLDDDGVTASDDYAPERCCVVIPNRALRENPPVDPCPPNGEEDRWNRQYPADEITVRGSITFSDGTVPSPPPEYVLIAPNGRYLTGEHTSSPSRGRPRRGQTDAQGAFVAPYQSPKGWYALQVPGYVVQVKGQPIEQAKGDFVCTEIKNETDRFDVIILPVEHATIQPHILIEGEA